MEFENKDLDSSWNFVYFGYSASSYKVYAFVKFGISGEVKTVEWEDKCKHNTKP